ncbi:hypothetical protein HYV69_02775 [Candidatus Uhrbacteria bacterium]|nr:hypothetical protein [Candidatus Uhrbacteria bacterium]
MRKNKKDQEISDVLSNFGFAFEFFKGIAHAAKAKGGTMRHLRRVVNEEGLQKQIANLIVPAGSTITQPISPNEYLIPVSHAPLPSLVTKFSL